MAKKTKDSNLSLEERLEQALIPNWDEPYKLPPNWCWVRVDAIASIYIGNSINERVKEEKYTGRTDGFVYLATKGIDFDSTIDYETNVCIPQSDGFKVAPKYSTLLCIEGGSAGRKIGFITQDVCFVNKLCAFVPHSKINPKYLYYAIQSDAFKKQFDAKKHGLIGGVSVKEVSSIFIPFAPVEIQNKIVELIELVFNKLDEAKEKAQEVVDGFETRKAAILHRAFSGELTAKWREENEVSSTSWKKYTYAQLGTSKLGKMLDKAKNTGIFVPYLRNVNVRWFGFDLSDVAQMRASDEEIELLSVKKGDLFICEGGEPGRCAIWKDEDSNIIFQKALHRFRPNSNVISDFLCYYLYFMSINGMLAKHFTGSTIKHLTGQSLARIEITIPNIDEQKQIVSILNRLFEKENQIKETADAVIEHIDTIKKAILARAFRGELGTNDPSEESAVELLKQVLNTVSEPKKSIKRTTIPKALDNRIKTDLEHKIIKLYFQNKVDVLSIDLIMGVSSKKFEIMEALRDLQQRGLIEKQNDKYKLLG